jgi:hypothetical protein
MDAGLMKARLLMAREMGSLFEDELLVGLMCS